MCSFYQKAHAKKNSGVDPAARLCRRPELNGSVVDVQNIL